ncbi:3-dehydroquinate synthase II/3-amino-4-hydroxybenzoic acid synthase [Metabacillus crassostreae]|uniref:3-dehydroquinate synthase II n=1 Tax=Metabacillus crassostreae TaxID=929098 RepID=UPI00195AB8F6|nr:3-dehydroquinate synthase II [Metabacillus crassostreae]MBM7602183.1 3-dehydroquinate synthase II/3-amino-4-hydroxybenzoic acid synthase [Metabacillus crassostreae]
MQQKQRQVWYDGRGVSVENMDVWELINHSPIDKALVTVQQRQEGYFPQKMSFITEVSNVEELENVPSEDVVFSDNKALLEEAKKRNYKTCIFYSVDDREMLERCSREASEYDFAAVDFDLPTNIPLELIIARLEESNTVLLRAVNTAIDTEIAYGTLEKGSDGVLFATTDIDEVKRLTAFMSKQALPSLELHPMVVTEVVHAGMGVRACIDTTGIMNQDEGMIIGSTSGGGVFVCSETHYLPYMNLRPFRVNAGAVHSYVWQPDDAAEYLSDLKAGDKVLCVNTKGETRVLTVGRIKTEVRPMLLIKGKVGESELNVIVQDDWHIRIMSADGKPRNASTIQPGDELLSYICEPGRHVGVKVSETIIER